MKQQVDVWDLPTRLFHWGLLIAVFYSWLSIKVLEDMQQHFYSGYAVLTLLLFRLAWGFFGSRYSKFRSFFFPLSELASYAKNAFSSGSKVYLGHNPLGSLSALAILLVLIVQVSLGLFSTDDYFYGPLAGLVNSERMAQLTRLHLDNVNIIYAVLGLHVAAILFYQLVKRQSLTKAMITGKKEADKVPESESASNWLALVVFLICAGSVYCLVNAFADIQPATDHSYY